jgi:hypothetical protein
MQKILGARPIWHYWVLHRKIAAENQHCCAAKCFMPKFSNPLTISGSQKTYSLRRIISTDLRRPCQSGVWWSLEVHHDRTACVQLARGLIGARQYAPGSHVPDISTFAPSDTQTQSNRELLRLGECAGNRDGKKFFRSARLCAGAPFATTRNGPEYTVIARRYGMGKWGEDWLVRHSFLLQPGFREPCAEPRVLPRISRTVACQTGRRDLPNRKILATTARIIEWN